MPSRSSYFPSVVRGKRKRNDTTAASFLRWRLDLRRFFCFGEGSFKRPSVLFLQSKGTREQTPPGVQRIALDAVGMPEAETKSLLFEKEGHGRKVSRSRSSFAACQSQEVPQVLVGSHSARPKSKRDTNGQLMDHSQGDQRDNTLQGSGAVAQDRPADGSRWNWSRHPVGRGGGRSQVRQVR